MQWCQSSIFTPMTGWKIEARTTARATNPEKIPENIGRKPGALRIAFPDPIKFCGNGPVKLPGP